LAQLFFPFQPFLPFQPSLPVTRVLSGAVLIAIAVAVVWFSPPILFFAVA
jgi:hypothetical protein